MMLALRCHQPGNDFRLSLDTIASPVPGPTQVIVDVHAAGINYGDLAMAQGKYHYAPAPPLTLGMEVAGVVREVGNEVTRFRPGDRVMALTRYAGFAEQVAVDMNARILGIPDGLDFDNAAAFGISYGTAWYALQTLARLQPGETLVVLGAGSGVGLAAVDLGRMLGARVVACASSQAKLQECAAYGAAALIDYSQPGYQQAFAEAVKDGLHVVLDAVGGQPASLALEHIGFGGRYLVVGYTSGEATSIPLKHTLVKGCSIIGVASRLLATHHPLEVRENLLLLAGHIVANRLQPLISRRFSLAQAADAVMQLQDRGRVGKHIVQVRAG